VFAKEFMKRHGIPTADFVVFDDDAAARDHVASRTAPMVIKAEGLAAGKGVYVVNTNDDAVAAVDEIMVRGKFGEAGTRVIVEDRLEGEEVSVHAVCAGTAALVLPGSQDHKRAFDGDAGPNTGGMGAYSPVPGFGDAEMAEVRRRIIDPTLAGMAEEGSPFSGTLYAGLMRTGDGPMVLEFNVRFGDPETEVLMPMIRGDVFELLYAAAGGEIPADVDVWPARAAATVVMAAEGYPGGYNKGMTISGLEEVGGDEVVAFHAGTARRGESVVTSGGRVLAVTAWNRDVRSAVEKAYTGVSRISFDGAFWRRDIGHRAL
jgi:phosphoribosylamine--glycine ligase